MNSDRYIGQISGKIGKKNRYIGEISPIISFDRLLEGNIVSTFADTQNISEILVDISDISITGGAVAQSKESRYHKKQKHIERSII